MIGEARERFTKDLWSERRSEDRPRLVTTVDETAQVEYVCGEVLAAREAGIPLKSRPCCSGPRTTAPSSSSS